MAQGAVVCVADGHVAIEAPHPETDCLASQRNSRPAALGLLRNDSTSQTCQDRPIFVAGSHLAVPSNAEILSAESHPVYFFSAPLLPVFEGCAPFSHSAAAASCLARREMHRVVLRI